MRKKSPCEVLIIFYDVIIMQFWLLLVTKQPKSRPSKMFYIFRRSTCICHIIVPSVRALVVVSIKRYFLHSNSCSDREFLSKNHSKMSLFTENREIGKNREIFPKYLKFHFRCFAILEIYFLVKFRPYISVFDKVTALLIL